MKSCNRKLFAASIAIIGLLGVQSQSNVCQKIVEESAPNYCEQWGQNHVACNPKQGDIKCGKSTAELSDITDRMKWNIIRQHNTYRNMVAKGTFTLIPIAARMLKIKWDENLAYVASQAIRKCNLSIPNDLIYPTTNASKPGYNAAYNKYPESLPQDELKIASSQIKSWFNQNKYVNVQGLRTNKSAAGQEIGHFKQLVTGLNDRVGCAILKYPEGSWRIQLMICLYGCHQQDNQMTYALGKVPGDKCQCGADKKFKNLCVKTERYGDCALIKDHNLEDADLDGTTTTTAPKTTRKHKRWNNDLLDKMTEWVLGQETAKL
ncbi:venom allergen 5.01-like [Drosophila albomicans]|uniref:Venom allergen 5.01-like n=1 Tax=Drosophila albomicans TaxID=7291 RepID=A0A6P8WNX3_DROAB|nr:venom allergen 5.01-like [Drosophila albomicans]